MAITMVMMIKRKRLKNLRNRLKKEHYQQNSRKIKIWIKE
jgi:hypothetical protein